MRRLFVWLHRYVGLVLAAFLIIEGATGSLIAFRSELTLLLDPAVSAPRPPPQARRLDLATLAERAETAVPQAKVRYFYRFNDKQVIVRVDPRIDPATGEPYKIDELIVLDPWTGNELERFDMAGYNKQGIVANIMPFIYDLHTSLALNVSGYWILAIVAILWTVDCFIGFYLTLPLKLESFWRRWKPAWLIKWRGGFYRVNFDLHRAGGLWFWAMLFVFAWSSVLLVDKTGCYEFVMSRLFDYQNDEEQYAALGYSRPLSETGPLKLGWRAAQTAGEKLVAELAQREGFKIERAVGMSLAEESRLYIYVVRTDRRFPCDRDEILYLDADTGALIVRPQTNSGHIGNTVSNWLRQLHMIQNPVDYVVYRIFVVVIGIVIVTLSVTGVYIWWKKRKARVDRLNREHAIPPIRQESLQTNQTTAA